MKPTAYLVNTARGPIVDEAALLETLQQKKIAGAAVDVFSVEPLPVDHPFRKLDNIVLTPHLGYVTRGDFPRALQPDGRRHRRLVQRRAGAEIGLSSGQSSLRIVALTATKKRAPGRAFQGDVGKN